MPARSKPTYYLYRFWIANHRKKWQYVVKGQSKYSKCFSEFPVIQGGLVGDLPTVLHHNYLSWCNHHRLGALTLYFTIRFD